MIQMIKTAIWGRCQIPLFLAGSYVHHTNYVAMCRGMGCHVPTSPPLSPYAERRIGYCV